MNDVSGNATTPFVLPPYPYDRLAPLAARAASHDGGMVDLSVGTPRDAAPPRVREALASSARAESYPPSIGIAPLRDAAVEWLQRRFGATVESDQVAACIGTKEVVAGIPQWLKLRRPDRDTVLYPQISYPTYAMGAHLAGCRAIAVPVDDQWRMDLGAIDPADAARALCLWVNTPGNPAGGLDDLAAVAAWGRAHDVPVLSDECYIEFTWDALDGAGPMAPTLGAVPGRTILSHGTDGVLAVHSLSKRSNLAGLRAGFYAGDAELVHYLSEVRKHAGMMVPGPVQDAAVVAFADDEHVEVQRERYWNRLLRVQAVLERLGVPVSLPQGAFYLWAPAPDGDAWALAERLAIDVGMLVSPGEFYGPTGNGHIRVAVVEPEARLTLLESRLI